MKPTIKALTLFGFLTLGNSLEAGKAINLDTLPAEEATRLKQSTYMEPPVVQALYQVIKDTAEILEEHNIPYWMEAGTLLGAVRHKGLLRWDDDGDFGTYIEYLPAIEKLAPRFAERGYAICPQRIHDIPPNTPKHPNNHPRATKITPPNLLSNIVISPKLPVHAHGKDLRPSLDIFGFMKKEDGKIVNRILGRFWHEASELETLKRYPFGPLQLWGPSNAEVHLDHTYKNWNTTIVRSHTHLIKKQPVYQWTLTEEDRQPALPPEPLKDYNPVVATNSKEVDLANPHNHKLFWDKMYTTRKVSLHASSFSQFLLQERKLRVKTLVDIGCGNGKDTFAFWRAGINAHGIDASERGIEEAQRIAQLTTRPNKTKMPAGNFKVVDVANLEALKPYQTMDAVYARFFLHSIPKATQDVFLEFLGGLKEGAQVFLEFRTDKDPMFERSEKISETEGTTDHYRRFINVQELWRLLKTKGIEVEYALEAKNLSIQGTDNPFLGRILGKKI